MLTHAPTTLVLAGRPLTLEGLEPILGMRLKVTIGGELLRLLEHSRRLVDVALASGKTVYGINTGFGHLKSISIAPDQLEKLQENLVRSHSVGVGHPAGEDVVRWMMLLKMHSLLQCHSGVRPEVIALLRDLLNGDCLPVVPSKGSLGASGDLAPLAHMALALIGEGLVTLPADTNSDALLAGPLHLSAPDAGVGHAQRTTLPAAAALRALNLKPVKLAPKEGLALLNGTQYMTAIAAIAVVRARRLAGQADLIAAMSLEACRGSAAPFDDRLHQLRPHPGARAVAENMRALLADSQIMLSHANCDKVQDPYSLRCIAPVHGASRDAIEHAARTVEVEINSVTDNPILFDNGDIVSGGNFHGQPLALVMDYLAMALAEYASISERRTYFLLDGQDGLPPMLTDRPGLNSGLMMLQYTAAALVNENKVLATPACIDTIPTSRGQEDHVSMGGTSANKLLTILENVETVLAIELLCAAQALDFREPLTPGSALRAAHRQVRALIPHVDEDRVLANEITIALKLLQQGSTGGMHAGKTVL